MTASRMTVAADRARTAWFAAAAGAIVVVMGCGALDAAPRIPPTDSTVLETVPAAAEVAKLAPLRARVASHPGDVRSALALAQGYLDIGRTTADPRFVSYAQAALAPWVIVAHPNPAVLNLDAAVLQYLHRFDEAVALLDRSLAVQPLEPQAWLMKSTILQVQGHFDAARQACRPLIRLSGQLIALTCLTSVNSLTGRLAESYAAVTRVYDDDPALAVQIRVWIQGQLADMAMRLGDTRGAEEHWLRALRASPEDPYVKAGYADLLLSESRNEEIIDLLRRDEQQDNLLLRLAIAGTRLGSTDARRWSDAFEARYQAARRDGDFTHLREQAVFLLEVRGKPAEALALAERNWQVQREPADVRIYLAAATRQGDARAMQRVRDWISLTHYEDRTLALDQPAVARR